MVVIINIHHHYDCLSRDLYSKQIIISRIASKIPTNGPKLTFILSFERTESDVSNGCRIVCFDQIHQKIHSN